MAYTEHIEKFAKYHETFYYPALLKGYRERVITYYSAEYEKRPDSFPLMKPIEVVVVYREYHYITLMNYSKTESDVFRHVVDDLFEYHEHKQVDDLPKHLKNQRLLELTNLDGVVWQRSHHSYGDGPPPYSPSYSLDGTSYGHGIADRDFEEIAKYVQKSKFLFFDISQLAARVNDDDFQYELEEAIKAYNAELFLASTITAAVSIETLLKISVFRRLGEESIPKRYFILNLAEVLLKEKIIDERLFQRIKSFNELRRGVAHSKSGGVQVWDAENAMSLIKIIVESLF